MTTVYTYTCNDGVTRTRCHAHMERRGPYAPHPTKHHTVATDGPCVVCDTQARHQPSPATETDEE